MEIIVILFTLFVVKHFIADFILQTDVMVQEKGTYGAPGGLHHACWHGILTAFILYPIIGNVMVVLQIGFIDALIHYHIDWAKTNISKQYTPENKEFWFWLGVDQMLHYLTYVGLIAWMFSFM